MEEGTGTTVIDSSGNGHALTLTNFNFDSNSGWANDTPPTTQTDTKSLLFDGANDVGVAASSSQFNLSSAFTIEAWIRASSSQVSPFDRGIVSRWNGNGYMMFIDGSGHIMSFVNGSTLSDNVNLYDDSWHHAAIVWDGTNRFVYIDGILKATDTSVGPNITDEPILIGNYFNINNERRFRGNIDEVMIWNTARSVSQIQTDAGITVVPTMTPTVTPTPTVTLTPTLTPTPTGTQVFLNEFMPKPSDDHDWIEIVNVGGPADISGWQIADTTGNIATFPIGTILSFGELRAVSQHQRLNNRGDTIFLRDTLNNTIDSKSYLGIEVITDKSIGRNPDGFGPWKQCFISSRTVLNSFFC